MGTKYVVAKILTWVFILAEIVLVAVCVIHRTDVTPSLKALFVLLLFLGIGFWDKYAHRPQDQDD